MKSSRVGKKAHQKSWRAFCPPYNLLVSLLFTMTLFISSGLLFWVQPMMSKMLLPLLGGVPAVWNTCLVFYQGALLAGYGYAHLTSKKLTIRIQLILHLILLWLAFFGISFSLNPLAVNPFRPVFSVFSLLLGTIGFPFFVLAATTPMLQRWLSRTTHPDAKNPYILYAASNAGSFLALLSYPFVLEPFLRLHTQNQAWNAGYGILAILLSVSIVGMWNKEQEKRTLTIQPLEGGIRRRLHWLILGFIPSSLLLGVTNHITTDISPIPLFWVIPLSVFLLTFVLVFARNQVIPHEWTLRAQTYLVFPVLLLYLGNFKSVIWLDFPIHLVAFFVFTMVCHGELAQHKPSPDHLTEFYLWMATGGVLGGIFTAILAPVMFNSFIEYPLMIVAACVIRPAGRFTMSRRQLRLLFGGMLLAVILLPAGFATGNRNVAFFLGTISLLLMASCGGAVCFSLLNTPKRIALGLGSFLLAGMLMMNTQQNVLERERSFFSTLKVAKDEQHEFHLFYHGTTLQGVQHLEPEHRRKALAYFHQDGPVGQIFGTLRSRWVAPNPPLRSRWIAKSNGQNGADLSIRTEQERQSGVNLAIRTEQGGEDHTEQNTGKSIAVFGLGVGTLATYARPGDSMVFYEIDPAVEEIARNTEWFSYLADSPGDIHVIPGDARISLAQETAQYDMIIQDAFSSDTVPVHLLTREAFHLYQSRLVEGGLLAFNITNRYLDLEPVLAELLEDAGLMGFIRRDLEKSDEDIRDKKFPSIWVVAARNTEVLGTLQSDPRWKPLTLRPGLDVWTDDYSNVLSILKSPFR